MLKQLLLYVIVLFASGICAQAPSTKYAIDAYPIGGKEQLEQVMETQLTLPKALLTSHFEADLTVYFDVDSTGTATNIKVEHAQNNALRNEIKRMFSFIKFARTQNVYGDPYVLNFKLSTEKYHRFFKQKYKLSIKKPLPADSSYTIYSKADRSPEYFKNGEEGIKEMILTGMDYPKLAIEKSIQGTVVVEFVVETNGYITGVTVRQPLGGGCTEEAIRVIKFSRWQPAVLNGKFVRYKTSYPITFNLRNVNKDNTSSVQGL